jgi:antitoxin component YwqK of YwqJK toxin-antitoxin module
MSTGFYPGGKTMAVVEFRGGVVNGTRQRYDQKSELVMDETYKDGRQVAVKADYHDQRKMKKKSEATYLHARYVVQTEADWWNADPAIYSTEGTDQRHGPWVSWHQNGQKQLEGTFDLDQRDGKL